MFLIASLVVVAQSAADDIERFAEFKNEAVGLKTEISTTVGKLREITDTVRQNCIS